MGKKTYRGSADEIKVPEDKCHMVLPEIEEEDEDHHKLSLTSLLLEASHIITNIGLGEQSEGSSDKYHPNGFGRDSIGGGDMAYSDRSPRYHRRGPGVTPVSWRNGQSSGQGSARDLYSDKLKCSLDSIVPSDEEEIDRRGSLPATPRGSRLTDIIQDRKRRNKRKGFTWTPFVRDDELPHPRTPQPQMLAMVKPHVRLNGDISTEHTQDPEQYSLPSENSFRTASSEPQENLIPKQVSDSYQRQFNENFKNDKLMSSSKYQDSPINVSSEESPQSPYKPVRTNKRHQTKE